MDFDWWNHQISHVQLLQQVFSCILLDNHCNLDFEQLWVLPRQLFWKLKKRDKIENNFSIPLMGSILIEWFKKHGFYCRWFSCERLETNARDFKVTQRNLISSFVLLNNFYGQLVKLTYENQLYCALAQWKLDFFLEH